MIFLIQGLLGIFSMYLNKRYYILLLFYSTIFISATGVEYPFYNFFTIKGVNLFIIIYFFLVIDIIFQKDYISFIKNCNICKIYAR